MSFTCISASVFFLTSNLILFNADVNWLPGSLAHMVIPGSQYSNFTRNIFIVVIYFWARVNTNKDCCCCCCCCYKCTFYMFYRMIIWTQGSKKWICFSVIQFFLPWRTFTPWWFKQNWLSTHFVYYYFFSQSP